MKKIINCFGHLFAIISVIILFVKLGQHHEEISRFNLGIWTIINFILSVAFTAGTYAITAYISGLLLQSGGFFLTFKDIYMIVGQSQIAKYLPGNVFHYFGQIALCRRVGISSEAMILSMGVHTFIIALTSASIAMIGLFFDRETLSWLIEELNTKGFNLSLVIMVLLVIFTIIILFLFPGTRSWFRQRLVYFHPGRVGISIILYLIVFAGYGIIISLLLRTLWGLDTQLQWYHFTWGFSLAWFLGFIVPGAPGGIGIREAILVVLYSHELGVGIVIGLAIVLRMVTSIGDLITFGLAYWLNYTTPNSKVLVE